jgi:hypothetical protein
MLVERGCWERGCACYDSQVDECVKVTLRHEWKDLTTAETKALWNATKKPSEFAKLLTAKLKEKNYV